MFAWFARRRSWKELPVVTARLGLNYHEAKFKSKLGTFSGLYDGQRVLVRPDKPAIIVDYKSRIDGLEMSTWGSPNLRRPDVDFRSGDRDFDRLFRKRKSGVPFAEAVSREHEFLARVVGFRKRFKGVLSQLDFSQVSFSAWIRERGMTISYISAKELEEMLPEMTHIVRELERINLLG